MPVELNLHDPALLENTFNVTLKFKHLAALTAAILLLDDKVMEREGVDPILKEPAQEIFEHLADHMEAFLGEDWEAQIAKAPMRGLLAFLGIRK